LSEDIKLTITPHPDIELGNNRSEIEAFLTLPKTGINEETGVIIVVGDLGEAADTDYQSGQLRPYLADRLNCIAVGVNYFGIYRSNQIQIFPSFLTNINRIYNLSLSMESFAQARSAEDIYRIIAEAVIARNVTSLDLRCQPFLITGRGEYQSWGFLPAIDHLQVLGEVLQRYNLNQRKIIAYGKNYGAYTAMLMGKYAPHTFSAIIDWGGYSRSELKHVVSGELIEADYLFHFVLNNGVKFYIASACNNPWTITDETSPYYYSDSHRRIRSLLDPSHCVYSDTHYYVFHSEDDASSIIEKDKCVDILRKFHEVDYHRKVAGSSDQIVSYKDLIDRILLSSGDSMQKGSIDNDFTLNSVHLFDCSEKSYKFTYNQQMGIEVAIVG